MKGIKRIMKAIGKRTTKVTKEANVKKIYTDLTEEQKAVVRDLVGKIICGEVKNFYSTKMYKTLSKELKDNQRIVVSYICKKASLVDVFENVEDLTLTKE